MPAVLKESFSFRDIKIWLIISSTMALCMKTVVSILHDGTVAYLTCISDEYK